MLLVNEEECRLMSTDSRHNFYHSRSHLVSLCLGHAFLSIHTRIAIRLCVMAVEISPPAPSTANSHDRSRPGRCKLKRKKHYAVTFSRKPLHATRPGRTLG